MKYIFSIFFFSFILSVSLLQAQNPKKYYKTSEEFIENKRYKDAVDLLTKAIDIDPAFEDAYLLRAFVYEQTGNMQSAVEDYKRASVFLNKDTEVFFKAGRAYYKLGNYGEALEMINKALDLKKNNIEALQLKVLALIALEDYFNALQAAEEALKIKSSAQNYYYQGLVSEKLKNKSGAIYDYGRALKEDKNFVPAYIALARLQLNDGEIEKANKNINEALSRQKNNVKAYLVKSEISKKKHNYVDAINDISEAILIEPENAELYFKRGQLYQELKQHQNAAYDFSQAISKNENYVDAYYQKALSNEKIKNKNSAKEDFQKLIKLIENDFEKKDLLAIAEDKLFELNRENNEPELKLTEPLLKNNVFEIPQKTAIISIKGRVADENEISFVKINNNDVPIIEDMEGLGFDYDLSIAEDNLVSIIVGDVYNNILHKTFEIKRTEVEPPKISILAPYASDNGDVYLPDSSSNIYIEGKIEDESTISSVIIEDITASYKIEELNPTFSATINIANKNKFKIRAIDKFGNESTEVFRLSRESANILAGNPMGKTWVVFIENSDYENFTSPDSVSKDIILIKQAFSRYAVHNYIHKRNMGKQEMERFFAIELRDLIRSNKVNSLLIWYSGNTEFVDENGYWIPVDARQDEKFTYFSVRALKASLQGYTKYLTHALVMSNSCYPSPAFYEEVNDSTTAIPTCENIELAKHKSSQVFSFKDQKLPSDSINPTKILADVLINNTNTCIPIDEIYRKVSDIFISVDKQKPAFGYIKNMEAENGTFFFMVKGNPKPKP